MPLGNGAAKALRSLIIAAPLCGCAIAPAGASEESQTQADSSPATAIEPAPLPPRIASEAGPFVEDFTTLDRKRWLVSHDWKNGKFVVNDWQRSQSRFGGPLSLVLEAGKSDKHPYSSGEVQSRARYGHGYFETTLRAAKGSGLLTGFFTYTGPPYGKPWNEIDVEFVGARPKEVLMTYHFEGKKSTHRYKTDFDTTAGFHTYGFDWQPGYIEWYIDGEPVFRRTGETLPLPNEPQKIFVTLLGSETLFEWLGKFDGSVLPKTSQFSCAGYSPSIEEGMPCWDKIKAGE